MRKLNILFVLASVLMLAAGCGKKVNVAFTSSSVHVAAEGGDVLASLTSNGDWKVDSRPEWLTVSPTYGSGDTPLTLTVSANPDQVERVGEVKVSAKDNTATLVVTQAAATPPVVVEEFITITPDHYQCGEGGGEFNVTVSSNIAWTVSGVPDWMTCTPLEGTGEAVVTLTVSAIAGEITGVREVDLIIGNQDAYQVLHVVQSPEPQIPISVTPNAFEIVCQGDVKTVAVSCEGAWSASANVDWVTLNQTQGEGDAEVVITVAENQEFTPREASVVFVSPSDLTAFVSIHQAAAPEPDPHYLEVSPLSLQFSKQGGSQEISISCDDLWKIEFNADWLTASEMLGTGDATVVLTAAPNTILEPRSCIMTVVSESLSQRVAVLQEAGDEVVYVTLEPDTLSVSYTGATSVMVSVTSNTTWNLQASSWITNLPGYMMQGDATLYLIVDVNSSPAPRYGFVRALHNGEVVAEVIVFQDGKPDLLETDVTEVEVGPEGGDFIIHVTSNQNWVVASDVLWMTCTPTSGFGNGDIRVTVDAMMGTRPRTGHIQLKAESGRTVIVTFNQHQ